MCSFLCLWVYACDTLSALTMEYQKAISILKSLPDRHPLNTEEKEAVLTAILGFSLESTSKSKIKAQKPDEPKVPYGNITLSIRCMCMEWQTCQCLCDS